MSAQKFFRNVWRFNSIAIALAAIGTFVSVFGAIVFALTGFLSEPEQLGEIRVDTGTEVVAQEYERTLSVFTDVEGTDYIMASLVADTLNKSYYSQSLMGPTNFFFVNTATDQSHWLVEDSQALLWSFSPFGKKRPSVLKP